MPFVPDKQSGFIPDFPKEEPIQSKKSFMQKLGSFGEGLGNILGGTQIGKAIGTGIANRTDAAQYLKNAPAITHQGQEIVPAGGGRNPLQGPTGKQIAGDVLKAGTTIAAAALPGAASLAGKVAQGGAIGYSMDVSEKLTDQKDNVFKPGVGTVVGAALPIVFKGLSALTRRTLGGSSGAGNQVIDRAVKNPNEVNQAIRTYAQDNAAKAGLVERARNAVQTFLGQRNTEFGASLSKTTFSKPFSKQEILNQFSDELGKFKGKITNDGLKFESTSLTAADRTDLSKFYNELRKWKDLTPGGLEDLRQSIGNHMDQFKLLGNAKATVPLGNLKRFVTQGLEERAPGYKSILADYGKKTQLAKDLLSELNLKTGNSKPSTQLNSIMRLFKKDPQVIKNLTQIMGEKEANALLNEISGAILSDALPQGLTGAIKEGGLTLTALYSIFTGGIPLAAVLGTAAASSPRIVGEAATLTGKAIQKGVGTGIKRVITKEASQLSK